MKKIFTLILAVTIVVSCVFVLVGCNGAVDGADGNDGRDGVDGKSAYQLYKENNPDYDGDERQWLEDIANGKLASRLSYETLTYGRTLSASVTKGEAKSNGAVMTFNNCVAQLNNPIILPTSDKSDWRIEIGGVLAVGNSGVQLLTSSSYGEVGRVYLGANAAQSKVYLGVNIGGVYFNYCWGVSSSVIKGDHRYVVRYEDGEYLLQVDDGDFYAFDTINYNQTNNVSVTDTKQVCDDFNAKVRAVYGYDYIVLTSLGAENFEVNGQINYIGAETSSVYGYRDFLYHPLYGKTVYHLGSSISYGHANNGTSFAEQIRDLTGSKMVKQTVSGTTLTNQKDNSYAARWSNFTFADNPEFLILQLSTNDFVQDGVTIGQVSEKDKIDGFEPNTTASAIEFIIERTKQKSPDTQIIIYTCAVTQSWDNSHPQYGAFVDNQLREIAEKWNITVVDLYHADKLFSGILADDIHPNAAGYAAIFTHNLINVMTESLKNN